MSEHRRRVELRRREHGAHERPRLAAARVAAVDVLHARRGPRAHAVDRRRLLSLRGREYLETVVVAVDEPKAVAQPADGRVAASATASYQQKAAAAPSVGIFCGREGRLAGLCESGSFR